MNGVLSEGFTVSPLLFTMVLEALSSKFRTSLPWKLLYIDVLVMIADSIEEAIVKFMR